MNTVEVKLGYFFWYSVITVSILSLITNLYHYIF